MSNLNPVGAQLCGLKTSISQPFIFGLMANLLEPNSRHKVLKFGSDLSYQTAVLAELENEIFTVEIIEEPAEESERRLGIRGYNNIKFRTGNSNHC